MELYFQTTSSHKCSPPSHRKPYLKLLVPNRRIITFALEPSAKLRQVSIFECCQRTLLILVVFKQKRNYRKSFYNVSFDYFYMNLSEPVWLCYRHIIASIPQDDSQFLLQDNHLLPLQLRNRFGHLIEDMDQKAMDYVYQTLTLQTASSESSNFCLFLFFLWVKGSEKLE